VRRCQWMASPPHPKARKKDKRHRKARRKVPSHDTACAIATARCMPRALLTPYLGHPC
jgi:hypothetical protein